MAHQENSPKSSAGQSGVDFGDEQKTHSRQALQGKGLSEVEVVALRKIIPQCGIGTFD